VATHDAGLAALNSGDGDSNAGSDVGSTGSAGWDTSGSGAPNDW
jgi:hypothetical protein